MLKLSNSKSGKEIILEEGARVVYVLKTARGTNTGIIKSIGEKEVMIGATAIPLDDFSLLGSRKKGSGAGAVVLAALGGSMIGTALRPDPDPCLNCTRVHVEDEGGTAGEVLFVAGGVALIGLALNLSIKNSARRIGEGAWQLEVVNAEDAR